MVEIWLDSADRRQMASFSDQVKGFTTNPTLMKKEGVTDYEKWGREIAQFAPNHLISMEVIGDNAEEMYRQARIISSWGPNVLVKIPITNTRGEMMTSLIDRLRDIRLNVTAVFTLEQVKALGGLRPEVISVFAGRIHDAGQDASSIVRQIKNYTRSKVLWASPRQVYDIIMADHAGADIITVTPELLVKRKLFGKSLTEFSLETVKMFHNDAQQAGLTL